jgi:hypothetical protein
MRRALRGSAVRRHGRSRRVRRRGIDVRHPDDIASRLPFREARDAVVRWAGL